MRVFSSELAHSYESYSFGYCIYALREKANELRNIYTKGFLPYSGKSHTKDIFYMARSLRVKLKGWTENSENRRIRKRFSLERSKIPIKKFNIYDELFISFCLSYFKKRHGEGIMPRERFFLILESFVTHIVLYQDREKIVGYVFLVENKAMAHFFYSFYDLKYMKKSLGLWLMGDALLQAKEEGKKYFYLGTGYGKKGIYKTNFNNLEYWDGEKWLSDIKKLKELCRSDSLRTISGEDLWKKNKNRNV